MCLHNTLIGTWKVSAGLWDVEAPILLASVWMTTIVVAITAPLAASVRANLTPLTVITGFAAIYPRKISRLKSRRNITVSRVGDAGRGVMSRSIRDADAQVRNTSGDREFDRRSLLK